MTVREFAERVLFSNSLEEKLAPPPRGITDLARGKAITTPDAPGRPEALALRRDGVRAEFPGTARVEDEAERGKLLHFFANHELLATELMALVLLKFPEAPSEFRTGILRTLREEQMHTRLYLGRMASCGVTFGDLSVNGFFWNAVAPMPSPLDYVTRLSLTFEQANLDYSRGYAGVFAEAGDPKTAAILERIYRDEIGHVRYGLTWFRKWKKRESDWKAFTSRLVLPLSAARAKGDFSFNEEGRREAGLDEEYIRELRVCAQSKGRTPNIFWFNPGAEETLVPGAPSQASRRAARDLAILPAFLARREDIVVVPDPPSTGHLNSLLDAGLELPEIVSPETVPDVASRRLHELRPWARTPDALPLIEQLGLPCPLSARVLFSKAEHARFLASLVSRSSCPILCRDDVVGVPIDSPEKLRAWLEAHEGSRCILKAPWSTAGRNRVIREASAPLSSREERWITATLRDQGTIVAEPWLERILDFSWQFDFRPEEGLRYRGTTVMTNTPRGQFRSATVAARLTDHLDEEARRALHHGADRRGHIAAFLEEDLGPGLEEWLHRHAHTGPVGVDAFLYPDDQGAVRLKPVVEINPRYTMGRVAIELARFTAPHASATLTITKADAALPAGAIRLTPDRPGASLAAFFSPGVRRPPRR
jgi:uncharacterized ferritin-like protein (DUF455 family)